MLQNVFLRRFRPYLSPRYPVLQRTTSKRAFTCSVSCSADRDVTNDHKRRVTQLEAYKPSEEWYPRLQPGPDARWPIRKFKEELEFIEADETLDDEDAFTIAGARIFFKR